MNHIIKKSSQSHLLFKEGFVKNFASLYLNETDDNNNHSSTQQPTNLELCFKL